MPRRQTVSRRKSITVVGKPKESENRVLAERYRLDELAGVTRGGELYEGVDLSTGGPVAVKILKSRFQTGENFGARMKREFEVLQRISHPAIVRVLDWGEASERERFLVMEHAEGETLANYVKRAGPLTVSQTAAVVAQIGSALDLVHSQGFVHRDVNPANIQVHVERNGRWSARLLDFGLVKVLEPETNEDRLDVTGAVMIVGDAKYACQEQFGREDPSPLWDVYSLGATAFFALAGRAPYIGETDISVMMEILKSPSPTLIGLVEDVPAEVEVAVGRAMDKEPSKRWPSCGAFATALCRASGVEAPKTIEFARPMRRGAASHHSSALAWSVRFALLAAALSGVAWIVLQMRS